MVDDKIIVSAAVKSLASSVIISHNHPSGSLSPSNEDKNITRKLKIQLAVFNVQVLDHLIITEDSYYSFADEGQMEGLGGLIDTESISHYGIPYLTQKQEKELGIDGHQIGKIGGRDKIYKMVNERILSMIKSSDKLFWRKTWIDEDVDSGKRQEVQSFGRSFSTGKQYSGINFWAVNVFKVRDSNGKLSFVLRKTVEPFWLTMKQIKDKSGKLKKNAKYEVIVYFVRHFSLFGKEFRLNYTGKYLKSVVKILMINAVKA